MEQYCRMYEYHSLSMTITMEVSSYQIQTTSLNIHSSSLSKFPERRQCTLKSESPHPTPFNTSLDSGMSIRLVSTIASHRLLRRIDTLLLTSIGVYVIRLSNALVCASRDELLGITCTAAAVGMLVVVSGAAAHAEHPEETTADAERGC
jgi:hypothetical protein